MIEKQAQQIVTATTSRHMTLDSNNTSMEDDPNIVQEGTSIPNEEPTLGDSEDVEMNDTRPQKIFLVRWANRDFTIATSTSEQELYKQLEDVLDVRSAFIAEYTGPLFLDFTRESKLYHHRGEELQVTSSRKIYAEFLPYFELGQHTDIKILVNNDVIGAHRLVLEQFEFFKKNIAWKTCKIDNMFDTETVRRVVRYLYSGDIQVPVVGYQHRNQVDPIIESALKDLLWASCDFRLPHLCEILEVRLWAVQNYWYPLPSQSSIDDTRKNTQWVVDMANMAHSFHAKRLRDNLLFLLMKNISIESAEEHYLNKKLIRKMQNWTPLEDYAFNDNNKVEDMVFSPVPYKISAASYDSEDGRKMWRLIGDMAFPRSTQAYKQLVKGPRISHDEKMRLMRTSVCAEDIEFANNYK